MRMRFTPFAGLKFLEGLVHVRRDNPPAAGRFREKAEKVLRRLARRSASGSTRDLTSPSRRPLVIPPDFHYEPTYDQLLPPRRQEAAEHCPQRGGCGPAREHPARVPACPHLGRRGPGGGPARAAGRRGGAPGSLPYPEWLEGGGRWESVASTASSPSAEPRGASDSGSTPAFSR